MEQKTIKLIYEVHYITPMAILNLFGIRTNVLNRTLKGSDPNDNNDKLYSNGNTSRTIDGNGNSMITRVANVLEHKTIGEGL
jgi:hypothetical protein